MNDPEVGRGVFRGFSAGSHPKGAVHPMALETLRRHGIAAEGWRSKSWDEFAGKDAPQVDFIFTVCDNAAAETCPMWPGHPVTAHWGLPDPAAAQGDAAQRQAFEETYQALRERIESLVRSARP